MKIVFRSYWKGHRGIYFIVKHWIRPYRYFNFLFARHWHPVEFVISPEVDF